MDELTPAGSQDWFRQLFELSPDPAWIIEDNHFAACNDAAVRALGYASRDALLNVHPSQLSPPTQPDGEDSFIKANRMMALAGERGTHRFEWLHTRADGTPFQAEITLAKIDVSARPIIYCVWRDITDRKETERRLQESEQHFRTLANGGAAMIWTSGVDQLCNYFNLPWLRFTGRTLAQELGNGWAEGVHPDDLARCLEIYTARFERRQSFSMEYRLRSAAGPYRWILDEGTPRYDSAGNFIGYIGFCYDITERKEWEIGLRLSASVFGHVRDGILITDPAGEILDVNPAFTHITGYERAEVVGRNPRLFASGRHDSAFFQTMWRALAAEGYWSGEIWNRRKSGVEFPEQLTITAVLDTHGGVRHYVGLFSDITEQKRREAELERIAHYDSLTGLPNRALFADRLRQATYLCDRQGSLLSVAFIDLDGFKAINDQYGHEAGDYVLSIVSQRMRQALREGDTLARYGGDEFVAVLIDIGDEQNAAPLIDRLLAAASEAIPYGEHALAVSASIGITYYPQTESVDLEQLTRQADQAMYHAKVGGKNCWRAYLLS